jgi:hypothetical protein
MAALLLVSAGPALAVSGFATGGPAVDAQYPDAFDPTNTPPPRPTSVASLGDVTRHERRQATSPKARADESKVRKRVVRAVPRPAGPGVSESGSISLLITGIAVLSIGGIVRWRRGGGPQAA